MANAGVNMKMPAILIALLLAAQAVRAADPPEWIYQPRGNFEGHTARPLRYWPDGTDFVITNGTEFFNRPLYSANSAFRADGGDKPEFSLYLPGRGGNLRLGVKTTAGVKWLNDAEQIVTRYRAGSLIYEIRDPLLANPTRVLRVTVLPLSETRGVIARVELENGAWLPIQLVWAFGGANGMRGRRGGDIGCETEPVSRFFQLKPEQCLSNEFTIASNTFVLHCKAATIRGVGSAGTRFAVGDAEKWANPSKLLLSASERRALTRPEDAPGRKHAEPVLGAPFPLLVGQANLPDNQPVYLALQQVTEGAPALSAQDLPQLFSAAEQHRRDIAGQVTVETPDPFINAAAAALCVAADAIWDQRQQAFMHGAVAWRQRLLGWRGPYAGDELGWHNRTAEHFAGFARQQNTNSIPKTIPPADEAANLARSETALHSNGDLTKSHYDMNLVGVDAFFRHLLWTGDLEYARQMWPVIERHLAWERRLFRREFGPDKLPLYEGYAAIWASDNMNYNGGGTAHASAYNFFENKMAARVARLIGKDPAPYKREADLIQRGMQKYLWLPDQGNFAEFKDYLGLQLVHPNAGLLTFYTTVDSGVPSPIQAWQMSRWVDTHIAHIPVQISAKSLNEISTYKTPENSFPRPAKNERGEGRGEGQTITRASSPHHSPPLRGSEGENMEVSNSEVDQSLLTSAATNDYYTLPETSWTPYLWSLNNVVMAEAAHTSLACWQANRPEAAFSLFKGCLLDSMYLGLCPGNVGAMTHFDMARGEAQRDFGDAVGITSRALVEGLFGVQPDALAGELKIIPGFPADWDHASIRHPDFSFSFQRDGMTETYTVETRFSKPMAVDLRIAALRDGVASVMVNGHKAKWNRVEGLASSPRIEIQADAAARWEIVVTWHGAIVEGRARHSVRAEAGRVENGAQGTDAPYQTRIDWNAKLPANTRLETVDLSSAFNDRVTQIFRNEYRSPRSPFCSLAIPKQGLGGWADNNAHFDLDDSGLRAVAAAHGGMLLLPNGVPFRTPTNADAKNIAFTSQWDNYPRAITVPLSGKAAHAYLLMAGSTGPMQSQFDNGEVIVTYTDGTTARLALHNPTNWWPIDQDYFIDDYAFRRPEPIPPRVDLKTGRVRILDVNSFKGKGGPVPGGAATVLDLPLNPGKQLQSLTVRTLANEAVIGLMAVTLER